MRLILMASIATTAACQGNGTFFAVAVDGGGCFGCGGFGAFGGTGVVAGTGAVGFDASFDAGSNVDGGGGQGAPWVSPFPNMGAPGFRNSTATLCADVTVDGNAIDVWSDKRGVFALVTGDSYSAQDGDAGFGYCAYVGCHSERLLQQDGTGWRLVDEKSFGEVMGSNSVGLRGVPNGRLFALRILTTSSASNRCSITSYNDGTSSCMRELGEVRAMSVVDATLAYAIHTSGSTTRLLRFDGIEWNDDQGLADVRTEALWADASQVLVLDSSNPFRVFQTPDGLQWNDLGGPLTGRGTALWARDANDVWVGTEDGVIWHFDGQAWQQLSSLGGVTCSAVTPIRGIWSSGESVYFYSATSLQRWNGTSFESLANWSCAFSGIDSEIQDLWGNSENEVFVAVRDNSGANDTCGGSIVVRFDGTQFHRM